MVLVGCDAEGEVPGLGGQPIGDAFGPFDGDDPRRNHKIFEEQGIDLGFAFEAIGIDVKESVGGALIQREEIEGRTGDGVLDPESGGESLHKSGFADPKIAVKGEHGIGGNRGGKLGGECPGCFGGVGLDAGAEFIADVRIHGRLLGRPRHRRRNAGVF